MAPVSLANAVIDLVEEKTRLDFESHWTRVLTSGYRT